jgi:hypothetical protein
MKKSLPIEKDMSAYLFTDFVERVKPKAPSEMFGSDWFASFNSIYNDVKKGNAEKEINFSDDRLVLVAYKVLCKVNVSPTDLENAVVERYEEIYGEDESIPLFMKPAEVIDDSKFYKKDMESATDEEKAIDENFRELKEIAEVMLSYTDLSNSEKAEWLVLLEDCNMMLG